MNSNDVAEANLAFTYRVSCAVRDSNPGAGKISIRKCVHGSHLRLSHVTFPERLRSSFILVALFCLALCLKTTSGAGQVAAWETKWRASQAAWVEDDDAELALGLLEEAFAMRPSPDAEAEMLKELVAIVESVADGKNPYRVSRSVSDRRHSSEKHS